MKHQKFYLVTLLGKEKPLQLHNKIVNKLVVDLNPTDWFVACGWHKENVLVNFWEINEGTFGEFPDDMQNTAWDEYNQLIGDEA